MKSLFALIPYLKRYKKKLALGFIFIILSIAFRSVYPIIIKNAIDSLSQGVTPPQLLLYALSIVGCVLVGGAFLFMVRQSIIVVSREIENDLRFDFFRHIQYLSRPFFDSHTVGNIMSHATNDINQVRNFLGPGIMYTVQTVITIIVMVPILISENLALTLWALVPLPFIPFIVYKVGRITYRRSLAVQESVSDLTTNVQENFSGIRVIKSYARESNELNKFLNISKDYYDKNLSLAKIQSFSFPMMTLIISLSVMLVLYFGGLKVVSGEMSVGTVAQFIVYLDMLTWPMIAFGWILNIIQRASPSMQRLKVILDTKPEVSDSEATDHSIKSIDGDIEFKNVSFKYATSKEYILKDINLHIRKGSTLGIVGHTGSGKSTFVNLITRLYDVNEGEILIDGKNIKEIPLETLRTSTGIVPQESFLFSSTIEENIAYSDVEAEIAEVEKAARAASLLKDITNFPEGLKTIVGERGITLSGGQKQRTSIARAIYKKPKILILDDSLSAVDTNTEEEILDSLSEIMKDRTSIIISHRVSTIKNANHIIVMKNGEIAEQGTHNELLAMNGLYAELYHKQLLEEEIKEI